MSEVMNGGHCQYFGNREDLDHDEVVEALSRLGAPASSTILREAIALSRARSELTSYDQLDERYFDLGYEETMAALKEYLRRNEVELIEWVD